MTQTLLPTPSTVHWGHFDATLKPVATINPGDTIVINSVSGAPDDLPAQPGMTVRPELTAIHAAVTSTATPAICNTAATIDLIGRAHYARACAIRGLHLISSTVDDA